MCRKKYCLVAKARKEIPSFSQCGSSPLSFFFCYVRALEGCGWSGIYIFPRIPLTALPKKPVTCFCYNPSMKLYKSSESCFYWGWRFGRVEFFFLSKSSGNEQASKSSLDVLGTSSKDVNVEWIYDWPTRESSDGVVNSEGRFVKLSVKPDTFRLLRNKEGSEIWRNCKEAERGSVYEKRRKKKKKETAIREIEREITRHRRSVGRRQG